MKRLKIYVCGPANSHDPEIYSKNLEIAQKIGEQIFKKGHFAYVQHTHMGRWNIDIFNDYNHIMRTAFSFIKEWADALFFIGHSKGADMELELAKKIGLKIFTDLSEIENATE